MSDVAARAPCATEGVRQHEAGGSPGGNPFGGFGGGGQQFTFTFGGGGGGRRRDPFDMFNSMFGEEHGGHRMGGGRRRGHIGGDEDRPKENLFAKDSSVTNLKQGKFPGTDAKHIWIIEFYAPWCGHCRQLKPVWERLALELKGFIKVGAVNCEIEKQICGMEGVNSFPTIKVKKSGISTPYEGDRDLGALKIWALEQLPIHVTNLRKPESLEKWLTGECKSARHSKEGACVVYFSDQTETPAWLKVLAHTFKGKFAVSEARARNDALALRLDVGSYPTLIGVCDGDVDHTVVYAGELSHSMTPAAVTEWMQGFEGGVKGGLCAATPKTPKSGVMLDASLDYSKMRVSKLKAILNAHDIPCQLCMEKSDFVRAIEGALRAAGKMKNEL